MAINRGNKDKAKTIPDQLSDILLRAFTDQALSQRYEVMFKDDKKEILDYAEHNKDGFEMDKGVGFKCEQGAVIFTERANWKYDVDKIIELVDSGHVTIATILNACNFSAEKLKTAIGEKQFGELASNEPTEYLTLKANSEFKGKVEEQFAAVLPKVKVEVSKVEVILEKPKAKAKKTDSLSKAKAAAAKAKTKIKSADADLADILGE